MSALGQKRTCRSLEQCQPFLMTGGHHCTIQHRRAVLIRPIQAEHWNEPGVRVRAASSCPIEKFVEFSDLYNFPSYDESLHNRSFTFAIKNRVPALLNGYFGLPH